MASVLAAEEPPLHLQLELSGVDLRQASWMDIEFFALLPDDLRFGPPNEEEPEFGESDSWLHWSGAEPTPIAGELERCLWDYVRLAEAPPAHFLEFARDWGMPHAGDRGRPDRPEKSDSMSLRSWREAARALAGTLLVLVDTENRTLSSLDVLWDMHAPFGYEHEPEDGEIWYMERPRPWSESVAFFDLPPERQTALRKDHWYRERQREREGGSGLVYQREALLHAVRMWGYSTSWSIAWNETGRVAQASAQGASALAGAHLRAIFTAPTLDVYLCSVCSRPFPFLEGVGTRRPRRGSQRFCSDDCQREARRLSNRASWHRNKNRWRGQPNTPGDDLGFKK